MAKKPKVKQGTAVWINHVGAIKKRVFQIKGKKDNTVLIELSPKEQYWIKKQNIRGNRVVIYKKGDGKISAQNPDGWGRVDLKKKGIKTLRFNLQNFALQERKASNYRWMMPQNLVDKLKPLFLTMFVCIAVGAIGWAMLKFGGAALGAVTKSRLMDCAKVLPNAPKPIAAMVNATIPVGAG